ncbi:MULTISPECIES: Flp family type IVb pilin [unclassified Methylophilus]|uniref:Flp family type IVb pilin n=2 Tax=unclassified Methylophilus TaxID=2630143 RepID=UPI001E2CA03A|nr:MULTISPECIES: Flp family type IVb pilin [unclassified Methylophilus]
MSFVKLIWVYADNLKSKQAQKNTRGIKMHNTIKVVISKFLRDEEGASAIEYALLAAMVAIALVTFVKPINGLISDIFTQISTALTP